MIYRGPGFLAPPPPSPASPVLKLSLFLSLPVCHRSNLLTGKRGRGMGWGGAKFYDSEKAWSSTDHSILSGLTVLESGMRMTRRRSPSSFPSWILFRQCSLKGQGHEIFAFWFFSCISFSQAPEYTIWAVSNFFENSRRYSQLKVCHQCC
jgi:hypothetical protein